MKTLQIIKQDNDKTISLIEHETTHTKYIQKELNYYDKILYQTLQKIKNPYLPKIFVVQENDNQLTLLEEYIEGNTLDQQILSKEDVRNIMHQLCECLNTLHKLNPPIIHRDIKPENIIYHNNKVTLLDFGIARFLDSRKSKDTLILGSVGYAAPEQFGFQQSNPQTDIYALGKLMNYLLNGSLEHQNNIPFDLKQIILKATQLDYKNRYKSVKEMDLAIQQKQVIIPAINNDTFKSKMISLAWIAFMFMVTVDMQPGDPIKNSTINKISCFTFMYFGLFLYYNKNLFHKHFKKIPWFILYFIIYFIFTIINIQFFVWIDSLI
ncbi:serine/threonine protein kinase [Holdemanella biformis]|jgi:serine/threonine protein kinase|uniref:serine/threonine-protein kinase n=1 Tax=Holdemanella biformis TaxID=1735 RepID=UPI001C25D2B1|nr:serine/threonine-protein kinase [Holdemanella biformis]MBU9894569.1 serine/threonine protein kinase [Holdemanella biformis]MBV3416229.1 serine/threonine protein kinase [Holdemanella biformis]